MTAQALLHNELLPLTLAHTGKDAFYWMSDCHVQHLPVVDGSKLVGVLSEEDLFNHSLFDTLASYDFSHMPMLFVRPESHAFDVVRVMGENRLTTIPVVDEHGDYLGLVAQVDVLRFLADSTSFGEPGGIVTLEVAPRDYALSTIARIVEDEDAKVLCVFVHANPQAESLDITLKINRTDLSRVVASLARHEFHIKQTYGYDLAEEGYKERFDSLMHYLNM